MPFWRWPDVDNVIGAAFSPGLTGESVAKLQRSSTTPRCCQHPCPILARDGQGSLGDFGDRVYLAVWRERSRATARPAALGHVHGDLYPVAGRRPADVIPHRHPALCPGLGRLLVVGGPVMRDSDDLRQVRRADTHVSGGVVLRPAVAHGRRARQRLRLCRGG